MAITDISISEELMTNAPSIKYRGNEGPKSPQEMEMMMMSGGQPLPEDPTKPINPFAPKPTGPTLPNKMAFDDTPGFEIESLKELMDEFYIDTGREPLSIDELRRHFYIKYGKDRISEVDEMVSDRQMAAYGGIMGADGRKQYGIGSFFQKFIMDPLKNATIGEEKSKALTAARLAREKATGVDTPAYELALKDLFYGKKDEDKNTRSGGVIDSIAKNIVPIAGGITAGLFTKNQPEQPGLPDDNTALQLAELKQVANTLDQKQGMAAGLNFLPAVSARKFTPAEMIETYAKAANGGRIGFDNGGIMMASAPNKEMPMMMAGGIEMDANNEIMERIIDDLMEADPSLSIEDAIEQAKKIFDQMASKPMARPRTMAQEGGLMDLGGMEKDYRAEGGFVPIGREEKADDVPARLSVNEFVFTADAVRNAGGGDIDQGAKVMENMMKHLEAGGQVSEESQGMAGAKDMFATSQRLGDVI